MVRPSGGERRSSSSASRWPAPSLLITTTGRPSASRSFSAISRAVKSVPCDAPTISRIADLSSCASAPAANSDSAPVSVARRESMACLRYFQ
jgi:hypothetical protein